VSEASQLTGLVIKLTSFENMKASSEEGLPIKIRLSSESLIAAKQSSVTETTQPYLSNESVGETKTIWT